MGKRFESGIWVSSKGEKLVFVSPNLFSRPKEKRFLLSSLQILALRYDSAFEASYFLILNSFGQVDLLDFIDWSGVECLNQSTSHSVANALKQVTFIDFCFFFNIFKNMYKV